MAQWDGASVWFMRSTHPTEGVEHTRPKRCPWNDYRKIEMGALCKVSLLFAHHQKTTAVPYGSGNKVRIVGKSPHMAGLWNFQAVNAENGFSPAAPVWQGKAGNLAGSCMPTKRRQHVVDWGSTFALRGNLSVPAGIILACRQCSILVEQKQVHTNKWCLRCLTTHICMDDDWRSRLGEKKVCVLKVPFGKVLCVSSVFCSIYRGKSCQNVLGVIHVYALGYGGKIVQHCDVVHSSSFVVLLGIDGCHCPRIAVVAELAFLWAISYIHDCSGKSQLPDDDHLRPIREWGQ